MFFVQLLGIYIYCFIFLFQWSPDGKKILFGMVNGEVHIFDNTGNFIVSILTYKVILSLFLRVI